MNTNSEMSKENCQSENQEHTSQVFKSPGAPFSKSTNKKHTQKKRVSRRTGSPLTSASEDELTKPKLSIIYRRHSNSDTDSKCPDGDCELSYSLRSPLETTSVGTVVSCAAPDRIICAADTDPPLGTVTISHSTPYKPGVPFKLPPANAPTNVAPERSVYSRTNKKRTCTPYKIRIPFDGKLGAGREIDKWSGPGNATIRQDEDLDGDIINSDHSRSGSTTDEEQRLFPDYADLFHNVAATFSDCFTETDRRNIKDMYAMELLKQVKEFTRKMQVALMELEQLMKDSVFDADGEPATVCSQNEDVEVQSKEADEAIESVPVTEKKKRRQPKEKSASKKIKLASSSGVDDVKAVDKSESTSGNKSATAMKVPLLKNGVNAETSPHSLSDAIDFERIKLGILQNKDFKRKNKKLIASGDTIDIEDCTFLRENEIADLLTNKRKHKRKNPSDKNKKKKAESLPSRKSVRIDYYNKNPPKRTLGRPSIIYILPIEEEASLKGTRKKSRDVDSIELDQQKGKENQPNQTSLSNSWTLTKNSCNDNGNTF